VEIVERRRQTDHTVDHSRGRYNKRRNSCREREVAGSNTRTTRLTQVSKSTKQPWTWLGAHLTAVAAVFVLATSLLAQIVGSPDISVTAVQGESWINHLHKPFNETSMGKTWDLGPAPPEPGQELPPW